MEEVLPGVDFELFLRKAVVKAYKEIDPKVEVNTTDGVQVSVT
jgi:hypothetical protein